MPTHCRRTRRTNNSGFAAWGRLGRGCAPSQPPQERKEGKLMTEREKATSSVVAVYRNHSNADVAVRALEKGGIPIRKISIIGRDFQLKEDVQGYYRPS